MSRSAISSTVVAASTRPCSFSSSGGIGREAQDRRALRLAPLLDDGLLVGCRERDADILEAARGGAGRRQRADVARDERERLFELEGTDHEEREVRSVREPLPIERRHRGAIELADPVEGQRPRRVVVHRVHGRELFTEERVRIAAAIGVRRFELALDQAEPIGVVARRREVQVQQLQPGLEVRRRARTRDALRREREER